MDFRSRKLIMPAHLNAANTLFGGQAMAWIDEEAAIFATCQLNTPRIVTKFISEIDFKAPARQGDLIEIGTSLVALGTKSITVACTIRNKTTKEVVLEVKKIVFVSLDEHGVPVAHGVSKPREA